MVSHMEKSYFPKKCVEEGRFELMLDRYIGECMVSRVNINNGVKEPTGRCRNFNTNPTMKFGGYVKVRESLYT